MYGFQLYLKLEPFRNSHFGLLASMHGNHAFLKMKSVKLDIFHSYIEIERLTIELAFSMVMNYICDWNFLEVVFLASKVYSVNLHGYEFIKNLDEGIFTFSKSSCSMETGSSALMCF